jgi:AcrR family transcriptional regulator
VISRAEQKSRTRDEVLQAARRIVRRQGFAATTARDVAAEAGVAVGTVFLHFPTMSRLAETLLDETVAAALATAEVSRPEGLIERLIQVSGCLYDAYDAEPELSREVIAASLFEGSAGGPSEVRMTEFRDWVAAEVAAAVSAGEIPQIDPTVAFLGYFALYFGALVTGLRGELDRGAQLALLRSSLQRLLVSKEN